MVFFNLTTVANCKMLFVYSQYVYLLGVVVYDSYYLANANKIPMQLFTCSKNVDERLHGLTEFSEGLILKMPVV